MRDSWHHHPGGLGLLWTSRYSFVIGYTYLSPLRGRRSGCLPLFTPPLFTPVHSNHAVQRTLMARLCAAVRSRTVVHQKMDLQVEFLSEFQQPGRVWHWQPLFAHGIVDSALSVCTGRCAVLRCTSYALYVQMRMNMIVVRELPLSLLFRVERERQVMRCSSANELAREHVHTVTTQNIGPLEHVCWRRKGYFLGS